MFIGNLQGIYEHPPTAETLKIIKQKHDESLQDYMKHFYNARNAISYIQDIEIINAFHDGVSDIKTVEEITMKKPRTVDDLLAVADVCINTSEAQARLLDWGDRKYWVSHMPHPVGETRPTCHTHHMLSLRMVRYLTWSTHSNLS
jgi:hypothetical protein